MGHTLRNTPSTIPKPQLAQATIPKAPFYLGTHTHWGAPYETPHQPHQSPGLPGQPYQKPRFNQAPTHIGAHPTKRPTNHTKAPARLGTCTKVPFYLDTHTKKSQLIRAPTPKS
ncbi:hypothetical protein L873DRAFT_1802012 [Choiromyces venosus 120613-1]|uniref:Uncharacterized protein n=1 Tax=Choiromyces venosus 120613-1 TaxID=1336337 RepID=A0A3N4JZ69_9PEZI|nr:hypothetical protein L873DRAFT_1802012 [Choiromyces venosus 120613-1]